MSPNLRYLILQMFRRGQSALKVGIKIARFVDTTLSVRSGGEPTALSGSGREQGEVQRILNQRGTDHCPSHVHFVNILLIYACQRMWASPDTQHCLSRC